MMENSMLASMGMFVAAFVVFAEDAAAPAKDATSPHIAFTLDGEIIKGYLNGELEGEYSQAEFPELKIGSPLVAIGADGRYAPVRERVVRCIKGAMDELRINNRALTVSGTSSSSDNRR
jgi:hypothetical protein